MLNVLEKHTLFSLQCKITKSINLTENLLKQVVNYLVM